MAFQAIRTNSTSLRRGRGPSNRLWSVRATAIRPWTSSKSSDLLAGYTTAGSQLFEVIEAYSEGQAVLSWKGQLLRLSANSDGREGYTLEPCGVYPAADSPVASFSEKWQAILPTLYTHGGEAPPSLTHVEVVSCLDELQEQVKANPSFWCDGLSPSDGVRTEMEQLMSTAGELTALMQGHRGVCIVQLYNGWDPSKGQPVYDPYVITLLEQALEHPDIRCSLSAAPGDVGLSLVLYADKEPYSAWGPHLCSFGCQANAVAGSTYYKLLVGRLLGYKPAHVTAYARAMGGIITPQVERQVEADLKKLSKAKAKIPWNTAGSRGKKKVPVAAGKGGFDKKATRSV